MKDPLKVMLTQFGVSEIAGPESNPEIMKYFHETGREWVDNEITPWCDAAMDWCFKQSGIKYAPGLNARGWLKMGEQVSKAEAQKIVADRSAVVLVVFWRVSLASVFGHVAFPIAWHTGLIECLGGNQNNKVGINPYSEEKVLSYIKIEMT